VRLDSGFTPVWGSSAIFALTFSIFVAFGEVLCAWILDLRQYGEVLPFLHRLFFDFCYIWGGSVRLDSGFAPVWGGSAIFMPAFLNFATYLGVLCVWIQDLRQHGEVLPKFRRCT
jgi:hypothetical protein